MKSLLALLMLSLVSCGADREQTKPDPTTEPMEFDLAIKDHRIKWQNQKISEWEQLQELSLGDNINVLAPELDKAFWNNAKHVYNSNYRQWNLATEFDEIDYLGHAYLFKLEVKVDSEGVVIDLKALFFTDLKEELLDLVEVRNEEWLDECEINSKLYICTKIGSENF